MREREREKETDSTVDGTRKTLKKCRPSTTRIEFRSRFVQRGPATCTVIHTIFIKLFIFSSPWGPVKKDITFLISKENNGHLFFSHLILFVKKMHTDCC
jgi:hypothetical protein